MRRIVQVERNGLLAFLLTAIALSTSNITLQAQIIDAYANADLHLVELRSNQNVHKCIEGPEIDRERTIYEFDRSGKLISSRASWGGQVYPNPKRDAHGRIIRYGDDIPNDMDGEIDYTYIEWEKSTPSYPKGVQFSGPECDITTKYIRTEQDKAYLITSAITTTAFPCISGRTDYTYLKFDKRGNWTQRLAVTKSKSEGKTYTEREMQFRKITYWDEEKLDLARSYRYGGKGVERDYKKAFEMFKELTEQRLPDPDALWELGRMYQLGLGTKRDRIKAGTCFLQSQATGNPYGKFWHAYYTMKDAKEDWIKENAKNLFSEAATQLNKMCEKGEDDNYTWEYLGRFFYEGIITDIDYDVAQKWFERSANDGNSNAMYYLATIYDPYGATYPDYPKREKLINPTKAEELYKKALANGIDKAQIELGNLYLYMGKKDKAVQQFEAQAKKDNDEGLYALGYCYELGHVSQPDPETAIAYYISAAKLGNIHAKKRLKEKFDIDIDAESSKDKE